MATSFWTDEEIALWQTRRTDGPYKSTGDVSTNSPGDWDRIQGQANTFRSNPTAERWSGNSRTSACVIAGDPNPGGSRHMGLRDAAFVYLLTSDETYRDPVRDELLWQSDGTPAGASRLLDFSKTTVFCDSPGFGTHPFFDYGIWLSRLAIAYDMIRSSLTSGEQTQIDAWLLNGAEWLRGGIEEDMTVSRVWFTDRINEDWTLSASAKSNHATSFSTQTHFGGFQPSNFVGAWSNRQTACIFAVGLIGLMQDNAAMKAATKVWIKEMIQFGTYHDSTWFELARWLDAFPQLGLGYSWGNLGSYILPLVDLFARSGDDSLYTYSTTDGIAKQDGPDATTDGSTAKTVRTIIEHMQSYSNGSTVRYGTDLASRNGNANYQIKLSRLDGQGIVRDVAAAMGNVFWTSTTIKDLYMRTASGTPAYPSTVEGGSIFNAYGRFFPGLLFMFGQMEGVHSPYEEGVPPPPPPPGPGAAFSQFRFADTRTVGM